MRGEMTPEASIDTAQAATPWEGAWAQLVA